MEFSTLLDRRRSIRAFGKAPVDDGEIQAVLEAADSAPSAGDLQAYEVVCVKRADTRALLATAALGQEFVAEAPIVLVFFADPARSSGRYGRRGAELYGLQDATIACAYAQLRAADLGLGSVWVGAFDEAEVARAVRAPAGLRPVALLPIGHPAESPEPTPRRGAANIVRKEGF
ncbi:MAG: nitroreductase family protein [Planctomycetes bacterium]|nr:nitroreductase family protein [Planctomycetota bacterium]